MFDTVSYVPLWLGFAIDSLGRKIPVSMTFPVTIAPRYGARGTCGRIELYNLVARKQFAADA